MAGLVQCKCGAAFYPAGGTGRPRTRCDNCRTNHDKIRGTQWNETREMVLARDPVCRWPDCGRRSQQVDHIIPLERGGHPFDLGNLQGLCAHHNAVKGARLPAAPGPLKRLPRAYIGFFGPVGTSALPCEYHYPTQVTPDCPCNPTEDDQ